MQPPHSADVLKMLAERKVPARAGQRCRRCGAPAVAALRRRIRRPVPLCGRHADALFGAEDPAWRRFDARTQRELADEWIRGMTLLVYAGDRPPQEILAEIAAVNDTTTEQIRLVSPLLPGEAHDLRQSVRAEGELRSRETMIHALVTQALLHWCAQATDQTPAEVLQRLALTLDDLFPPDGRPH